nr:MAG TPA: hypothetical protein [Caudoviricetes sp.]
MSKEIVCRFHIYAINKNGVAKVDSRTDDTKSVYMVVSDLEENNINGYVFDTVMKRVSEQF